MISYSQLVNDTKIVYTVGGKKWWPKNWYGAGYKGNVTVKKALEISINAIPVELVHKLTPEVSYDFLTNKLGITTLTEYDKNLSPLGMGGTNGGLTTLESAAAYAVFGNGGRYYEPTFYSKVTGQDGRVILEHKSEPQMAISEDTATVMNHLLQNVIYGPNGTGAKIKEYMKNVRVFGKTGTTNEQNDLWFTGGTPYYVASCWCGYKTLETIPDSRIAMKLWGDVMSRVHSGLKAKSFTDSSYAVKKQYCESTGLIANEACPKKADGWYRKSNIPEKCTRHVGKVETDKDKDKDNSSNSSGSSETSSDNSSSSSSASSSDTTSNNSSSSNNVSSEITSGTTSSSTSSNSSSNTSSESSSEVTSGDSSSQSSSTEEVTSEETNSSAVE